MSRSIGLPMALPGFVDQLAKAIEACKAHGPGDAIVDRPVSSTIGHLRLMLQETGGEEVTLLVAGEGLSYKGRAPIPASRAVSAVTEFLRRWSAAGIRLLGDATADEVGALLRIANGPEGQHLEDLAALARMCDRAGCRRVGLVAAAQKPRPTGSARKRTVGVEGIRAVISKTFAGISDGQSIDLGRMRDCADAILAVLDMAVRGGQIGLDLSRGTAEDPLAVDHAIRVSGLTMIAARAMSAGPELVGRLGVAALLHDVGRILLPFDPNGFEGTRTGCASDERIEHTVYGAEYLLSHEHVDPLCVAVAFGHHTPIGMDGGPTTSHQHVPSRFTQLVRIADLFEERTAPGPTRGAQNPEDAYRSLLTDEPGLDAGLVRRFVEANGLHPIGALVGLGAGVTARVVRQTAKPDAPIVRVVDPGRTKARSGALVDLSRRLAVKAKFLEPVAS